MIGSRWLVGTAGAILLLTGCASEPEVREVTPPSCIVALDINGEAFSYLGNGDEIGFQRYVQQNVDRLGAAVEDCRSKANLDTLTTT